jgi:DNA-binding GntR family transcriptional regulator
MEAQTNKAFRRISHETLNEQVYQEIRRVIMAGLLQPGSVVTIRGLAAQLGTSTMPVRDALRRLLAERILVMDGPRRYRLRVLSRGEFEEILCLRLSLEGELTELATLCAAQQDIETLNQIQRRFESSLKSGDNFLEANQDFHFALYALAQRPITLSLVRSLWMQVGPLLNHYRIQQGGELAVEHHRAVLAALKKRNAPAARAAIAADLNDAARVILDELPAGADDPLQ